MSDDALFTDAPAPSGGDLFTDEPAPRSYMGDVGANALKEIKAFPGSLPGMAKAGLGIADLPIDALKAVPQMLGGKSLADTDVAEDIKPVIEGNKRTIDTIAHPVDSFRQAPINTAGTFAGLLGGIKGALPEAPEVPNAPVETIPKAVPEAASAAAEAPKGLPVIEPGAKTGAPHALFSYNDNFGPNGEPRSIYNVFGDPEHPSVKAVGHGSSVEKAALDKAGIPVTGREPRSAGKYEPIEGPATPPPAEAGGAKPGPNAPPEPPAPSAVDSALKTVQDKGQEVKNYISRGYQGFAKKPGALGDVADWVQEKSQMMSAQQMGFTPLQNRQLGATPVEQMEAMRAIGQYGLDSNIVSPAGGLRHMVETNSKLLKQAGDTIGQIRKEADAVRDPLKTPIDPMQAIRAQLDPMFSRGARAGESGAYQRALEVVEDAKPTFDGMAEAATKLNKAANEANRLNQPHGAFTDVANIISRLENDRIREILPQKAAAYDQALKEFGINKKIEAALKRKVGGEVKRFGPGSIGSNMLQKGMDEIGYRVGAKAANKLSTSLKAKPSLGANLPSLFKEFANHVDDTVGEVSGMHQGGRVPDEIKSYVAGSC